MARFCRLEGDKSAKKNNAKGHQGKQKGNFGHSQRMTVQLRAKLGLFTAKQLIQNKQSSTIETPGDRVTSFIPSFFIFAYRITSTATMKKFNHLIIRLLSLTPSASHQKLVCVQ